MSIEQNLSLYRIFNVVAKTQNISKAASILYISQPAVSKAINRLESNLEVKLFTRSTKGVLLTEQGEMLYEYTKHAFDFLSRGEEKLMSGSILGVGHLKIGVSTTLCKYMLLPYLKHFVEKYPHIKITISCQSTFHTVSMLEHGTIDVGMIANPGVSPNLVFSPVSDIEDAFVATPSYLANLRVREGRDDIDIFSCANVMLLDEKNITRHYIDDYFNRNSIEVNQLLEVNTMDLLIEFSKIGLGVAGVIKSFIKNELDSGELVEIPLDFAIEKRTIGFGYMKSIEPSDSLKKFLEFKDEVNV